MIYLRMDTTHPRYDEAIAALAVEHGKHFPNCKLSIVVGKGTEALVKCEGLAKGDISAKAWSGAVVQAYDRGEHPTLRTMVKGANWKRT